MPQRHTITLDGTQLTFLDRPSTQPQKPPLLLLHGLIASADTFAAVLRELPDDRRIVALDLPGHDLPTREPSDLSLRGLARLVVHLSAALHLTRPIILGHSHGGAVALQVGASFPESITGLILICPAHPFLHRERWLIAFYNSILGRAVARSFRWFPEPFQGLGFRRLMGPKGRKAKVDFRPYRASLAHRETVESVLRLIQTWNADMASLGDQITQKPVQAPTLFLWGDYDPVVPIRTAAALQKRFLLWEQVTLRGVGHLPNDEDPEACGALIRTWLIWLATSPKYVPVEVDVALDTGNGSILTHPLQ